MAPTPQKTSPADADGDGISDAEERRLGTNPHFGDTDADGLPDREELIQRTDPKREDTDYDGLPDGTEVRIGTDPLLWDSDHDGRSDGTEIALRTDPHWREVRPRVDLVESARQPTAQDQDGDGLPFHVEQQLGTDPNDPDTDDDGLGDRVELLRNTDPLSPYSKDAGDTTTDLEDVEAELPGLRDAEAPSRVPPAIMTEFGHRIVFPGDAQSSLDSPVLDAPDPVQPAVDPFDTGAGFDVGQSFTDDSADLYATSDPGHVASFAEAFDA